MNIVLSLVAASVAIFYAYGFLQDLVGVQCSGIMGATADCSLGATLYVLFGVLSPIAMSVLGAASIYGVVSQVRAKRQ